MFRGTSNLKATGSLGPLAGHLQGAASMAWPSSRPVAARPSRRPPENLKLNGRLPMPQLASAVDHWHCLAASRAGIAVAPSRSFDCQVYQGNASGHSSFFFRFLISSG